MIVLQCVILLIVSGIALVAVTVVSTILLAIAWQWQHNRTAVSKKWHPNLSRTCPACNSNRKFRICAPKRHNRGVFYVCLTCCHGNTYVEQRKVTAL